MIGLSSFLNRKRPRDLQRCARCQMKFDQTAGICPYCGELDDLQVSVQLKQRRRFRMNTGKLFLYAAIGLGLMVLAAGFIF